MRLFVSEAIYSGMTFSGDQEGQAEWHRLVRQLNQMHLQARVDRGTTEEFWVKHALIRFSTLLLELVRLTKLHGLSKEHAIRRGNIRFLLLEVYYYGKYIGSRERRSALAKWRNVVVEQDNILKHEIFSAEEHQWLIDAEYRADLTLADSDSLVSDLMEAKRPEAFVGPMVLAAFLLGIEVQTTSWSPPEGEEIF